MAVAPPKPAHRSEMPWDPWCWLEVQIATATGSGGDPERVGYWQPDTPTTTDPRYTTWVADSAPIPPAGTMPPAGYGEWVAGGTQKYDANWNNINWHSVDCELTSATFTTGNNPWDWNASPGNGQLSLLDNDHVYFPLGPGSGLFDDIGVNTPIRVIAHLTAAFNSSAGRQADRVLVNGLIRRIEHTVNADGKGATSITFSEPHVLYGRVNRPAVTMNMQSVGERMIAIAALSDDPQTALLAPPALTTTASGTNQPPNRTWVWPSIQGGEVAADLWTELAKAANSDGMVLALRLYPSTAPGYTSPGNALGNGSPRIYAMPPILPPAPHDWYDGDSFGLDVRILTDECSPPGTTFNYTRSGAANRAKISNCPIEKIQLGHDDSDLANVVSIAAAGGSAVEVHDQPSIDRWYRHTYQRHDLVFAPGGIPAGEPLVAWRVLERLRQAVFDLSDCSFIMSDPRDFEFALGAAPANHSQQDHPPVEPGRWLKFDWAWVTADLRVTRVSHTINPQRWTVTHAYEVHNPVARQPGGVH